MDEPQALLLDDPGAFDPEDTRAMGIAFDLACRSLRPTQNTSSMRNLMAIWIVDLALAGERDPARLYETMMEWAANDAQCLPA